MKTPIYVPYNHYQYNGDGSLADLIGMILGFSISIGVIFVLLHFGDILDWFSGNIQIVKDKHSAVKKEVSFKNSWQETRLMVPRKGQIWQNHLGEWIIVLNLRHDGSILFRRGGGIYFAEADDWLKTIDGGSFALT